MSEKYNRIINEYRVNRENYIRLGDIVNEKLVSITKDAGIDTLSIEHRVKQEKSLLGKLYKHGDYYQSLSDITDILGTRIVCFFANEVDIIGKLVVKSFKVNHELSTDKRAIIEADKFGYMSLHYICSLRDDEGYPPELCGMHFEIQIKTALQHIWAVISHDIDYKNSFGVPRDIRRNFSRAASLLEIADDEFVNARDSMNEYTESVCRRIEKNDVKDIQITVISINEYVKRNKDFNNYLDKVSEAVNCEIFRIGADKYIDRLAALGVTTLEGISDMLEKNAPVAIKLAKRFLDNSDIDIIISNAALGYLCDAFIISGCCDKNIAMNYLTLVTGNAERAEKRFDMLFDTLCELFVEELSDEHRFSDSDISKCEKALEFAAKKHKGQCRMGGAPYILHPLKAAEMLYDKGYDAEHVITALFHDLLEDTDAAEEEITALGGEKVAKAVRLLTKEDGYIMADYVAGIRSDPMALAVKGADRLNNLESAFVADDDFKRKYIKETREWYMDLDENIPKIVAELEKSLEN